MSYLSKDTLEHMYMRQHLFGYLGIYVPGKLLTDASFHIILKKSKLKLLPHNFIHANIINSS